MGACSQGAGRTQLRAAPPRPDTPPRLWRQVEFYFSDSNLPKDKFLKERISEDPDGCE